MSEQPPPDPAAAAKLLSQVYTELKQLARRHMNNERHDHTLQPTALVHEAYLKIAGGAGANWEGRTHFFRAAAQSMRQILIDHARAKGNQKRGGGRKRVAAELLDQAAVEPSDEMMALDEAISRLEEQRPGDGEMVRLRFFGGLSIEETAAVLGKSPRTIKRDWTYARAWLNRELSK